MNESTKPESRNPEARPPKRRFPYSMTLANRITLSRIVAIPFFALMLIYYGLSVERGEPNELIRWGAMVLFLAVAISDALDGYFARSRNEVTHLGAILDPIADKALLLSAVILLGRPWNAALEPHLPIWYVLMVVSREIVLITGAFVIQHIVGTVSVRPRVAGKAATLFQMLLILWVLVGIPGAAFTWLLALAAFFVVIATILYVHDGIAQVEHK